MRRTIRDTRICWDNTGAESLWSTFKHDYYRYTFTYASELIAAVDNWIHIHNTRRIHSTIGMLSPTNFEKSLTATLMAAWPLSTFEVNLSARLHRGTSCPQGSALFSPGHGK
ncbi:integrase core domain-containing protein [Rhodococcus globerulus]|uniref:integrase core domain-containing protein n=1 Tax=Rhodococcus globerulus TaxID=33008 RepID=UPI003556A48E|nr:transposase [Rhodococcus globerulus]